MTKQSKRRWLPPIAQEVADLKAVAYNYHETKRDHNRAKWVARKARKARAGSDG